MAWVYLDDHFPEHPKVQAAGDEAGWLYVCALAYSQRNKTLGKIPKGAVGKLTGFRNPDRLARRLVDAGLWHDRDDHYEIHDYEPWNKSAVMAAKTRSDKARRAASARWSEHPPSNAQASAEHCSSNTGAMPEQSSNGARAFPPHATARAAPSPKPLAKALLVISSSDPSRPVDDDDDRIKEISLANLARRNAKAGLPPIGDEKAWLAEDGRRIRSKLAQPAPKAIRDDPCGVCDGLRFTSSTIDEKGYSSVKPCPACSPPAAP